MKLRLFSVAFVTVLSISVNLTAQDVPELQLQNFRPATGPTDYFEMSSSVVAPHLEFDFGLYLDFSDDPLGVPTATDVTNSIVDSQVHANLIANLGLFDMFEVGLLFPVLAVQTSGDITPLLPANADPNSELPVAGINDPTISVKYTLFNMMRQQFGLGFLLRGTIPIGLDDRFSGDESFSIDALVLPEMWIVRGMRIGGNFGYRYRHEFVTIRDSNIGDAVLWGLAASIPLFIDSLDALIEIDGEIGVAEDPPGPSGIRSGETPTELRVGLRFKLHEDWTLSGAAALPLNNEGVGTPDFRGFLSINGRWVSGGRWGFDYDGDGIYGIYDKCPNQPEDFDGHQDLDGCPDYDNDNDGVPDEFDKCDNTPEGVEVGEDGCPDNDLDGDGIPNDIDKCPEDPEDLDRFEDSDGCPDLDNDKDKIPDSADQCPNKPETYNDFLDEDGCPDDPNDKVHLARDRIIITEQVFFETGKAKIRKKSYDILDAVVEVMKENPQILKIRVEGHTDSRGSDEMNLDLSDRRAAAVMTYLTDKGVAEGRLESQGYGETTPIKTNDTAEGRAANRRVEFTILEMREY